jgi:signal transduction histidine kinase
LGLGLALCRAFVHRHGGTLVIQSRPGAGTNVTVSLPAAPAKAAPPKVLKSEKSPSI